MSDRITDPAVDYLPPEEKEAVLEWKRAKRRDSLKQKFMLLFTATAVVGMFAILLFPIVDGLIRRWL